jgi:PsbP-like protein
VNPSSSVEGVSVGTENLGVGYSLEDFRATNINNLQKLSNNFQQISSQTTTVDGKPAYKIVFQGTFPEQMSSTSTQNVAMKSIQIYTVNNGIGYVIAYKATQDNYNTYLSQAQQIIDSFKFI